MAPSAEERLAALEAEKDHVKELLKEIKEDLKFLPSRISRRTKKQLAECRAMQDAKQITKKDRKPESDDYSWLKKLLIVLISVGSVIGGAIYQYRESAVKTVTIQQQGGK